MTDISKCSQENCPKKDTCFRYLATDSEWQSYILIDDVENCDHYWKVDENNLKITQRIWNDL